MANPKGFLTCSREDVAYRPVEQRVLDHAEVTVAHSTEKLVEQAGRCMDCGIPYCHGYGCPLANRIPEFNDLVYRNRWREALAVLHSTNNFPEFTGRVCPAPCEAACTLNIDQQPVLIEHIEYQIAERGWQQGWIQPIACGFRTGRKIAVIGSGPAGLAAAQQLVRGGHDVTVFEKDDRIGGLLRYGIPDFKLGKNVIDRRLEQMVAEGVRFETGVHVGRDLSMRYLRRSFDAICLAMGAGVPRDLAVVGRGFDNVHFAMDFLSQQNRLNAGESIDHRQRISADGKVVVVIGGGDTGSDCVGTSIRQGAREVHQFEIMPQPPAASNPRNPWPQWPQILRNSSSHKEGCQRRWSVLTKKLSSRTTNAETLHACEVEWEMTAKGPQMREIPGSDFEMNVDLVLLAMGFVHVEHDGPVKDLGLELDARGNVKIESTAAMMTSVDGVFACGDTASGASLVVRAINSGRKCAEAINAWLTVRP